MSHLFIELGVIIIIAAFFAMLMRVVKLPPLIGYILAGVVMGPIALNLVNDKEFLESMHEIGIALLLFLVGLELNWEKTRHQFKSASVLGIIQAGGSFLAGLLLSVLAGQGWLTGVYIGAALAFSSTVIVVKFLSESRDINSMHGRLAIGILIVEDILALVAIALVSGFSGNSTLNPAGQIGLLVIKSMAMLALIWIISRYVFPSLFARIARSAELLFVSSIAWCFFLIMVMTQFDFSLEMAAFLAGMSLASLPYSVDITNRVRSLRDFFVILFFVSLGTGIMVPTVPYALLTVGLVIIGVIVKPIINFFAIIGYGYSGRTAFLTALTLSQLSEFSLIIVGIGALHGHIGKELVSAVTFATVISILCATIIFSHRNALYRKLHRYIRAYAHHGKRHRRAESITEGSEERLDKHIIIFGYHRMGYHILKKLRALHHRVLVVDFNPDIIRRLKEQEIDCLYGDVQDEDVLELIHADKASMIISTIPHREENISLINEVKKYRSKPILIVTSHRIDDALEYYKLGVNYVILPHLLGGEHVADLLSDYEHHELGGFIKQQAEELKLLKAKNHALYYD